MPYRLRRFLVLALILIGAWTLTSYVAAHFVGLSEPARALVVGVWAGLLGATVETGILPRLSRKFPFWATLVLRSALYTVVVLIATLGVIAFIGRTTEGVSLKTALQSEEFRAVVESGQIPAMMLILIFASFFINLMLQLLRVLGPGVMGQIFIGRYLRPVYEERIFLFLDLTSSTSIAEELGLSRFSEALGKQR